MARTARPWYRSSANAWYVTVNGRKVSLGIRGRENEAAAWVAWQRLTHTPPPPPVTPKPATQVRVAGVVAAFLADAAGRVEADTLKLYRGLLLPFSERHGETAARDLAPTTAEAYSRQQPRWNDSTRSAFLAVLARAFRFAERARLIDRTPLVGLRKPPIASRAADVLVAAGDHEKLAAAAPAPLRRLLTFLHLTGCRPSEAAGLTAADVNWDAATAVIRRHKTVRKGKRRVLYLVPAAVELLRELAARHPAGPLFRNRIGRAWTRAAIGYGVRKARAAAGLPGKIAYGYRHGFATDALAAGVPDAHVAELLGHSSTAMLHRHYSHLATRVKVLTDAA